MALGGKSLATLVALTMLGGCAGRQVEIAAAPPPAPAPLTPMPQPPLGAFVGMTIPARLADGSYPTPNRHLGPAATLWHLRVALNVAALGCRGSEGRAITAGYNAMLTRNTAELARANAATIAAEGGQAAYDEAMTRLYNYFAQPGAKAAFCAAAATVTNDLATAGSLGVAAGSALAALDRPFGDFYRAYDSYRVALAAWQADRLDRAMRSLDERPRVVLAASAPAAIGPEPAAPRLSVDPSIFETP